MQSSTMSPSTEELDSLLQAGITAARVGHDGWARELLSRAVELDGECLPAWLWLSDVADSLEEKGRCLEKVLSLDPDHEMARRGLAQLRAQPKVHARRSTVPDAAVRPRAMPKPTPVPAPEPMPIPAPPAERRPSGPGTGPEHLTSPVPDLNDLLQAGIHAASSRQVDLARELLGRVIEVNERHMSAWLWLSYVADTREERDRYVHKVINLVQPHSGPGPSLAAAVPKVGPLVWPQELDIPARALGLASPSTIAVNLAPTRPFYESLALDAAMAYHSLRTAVLEWASAWTITAQAYLAVIALAELLITFVRPSLGLVAHSLLLMVLLVHAARVRSRTKRAFLVSLAFAPLIRVLSLSLPLAQIPILYWYLVTSIPLFAALLVAARMLGFSWSRLGLNLRGWPLQLAIGLTGIGFGVVEYLILRPDPLAPRLEWSYLWRPALILLVSTGLLEEMIFRGLLQRTASDTLGRWGLLYVPLLFAALHIGYRLFLDVVFVLFVGLFFAWVVQRTRSLLGVTLSHGLTNIILFLVVPFLQI